MGSSKKEDDEPLLLATLCHLLVYLLPYAIGLLVILLVDAAGEKSDLIIWILIAAVVSAAAGVVVATLLRLCETKLLGTLLDGGRDLLLAGAVARRSKVGPGGEADSTSTDTCDIVLGCRLAQKVPTTGHFVGGMGQVRIVLGKFCRAMRMRPKQAPKAWATERELRSTVIGQVGADPASHRPLPIMKSYSFSTSLVSVLCKLVVHEGVKGDLV